MKLGGNRPPGDNPLLFSISGTGSFIYPVASTSSRNCVFRSKIEHGLEFLEGRPSSVSAVKFHVSELELSETNLIAVGSIANSNLPPAI